MRPGNTITKVPKIGKLKGKPIATFAPPSTTTKLVPEVLNKAIHKTTIETEHTSEDMEFNLHPKDPEWVIEFNKRFEEQARVLQDLQQEMTAMKQLQLELHQTKQQLADALEKIAYYESTSVDMDTDDFPAPQRTPQQQQRFFNSQGTDSSKYAHDYAPTGERPAKQAGNFAGLASKLDANSFKKKPTSAKQKAAIARIFDAPVSFTESSTPLFKYVYFLNKYRIKISSLRSDLRRLGVDTGRVIDIHYPSRGVVALLMHVEYVPTLTAILAKFQKVPLANYDHFSASNITTAEHESLSIAEKTRLATQYQQTRLSRALSHMRPQIRNTVAKAFALHGWLSDAQIKAALAATTDDNTFNTQNSGNNSVLNAFGNTDTTDTQPTTSPNDVDDDIVIEEAN
jgi:hypothetical protein